MPRGGKRQGAGRPVGSKKALTVTYYRSVQPEWVEILDKKLMELKKMEQARQELFKEIVKKCGDLLFCGELVEAVRNDWDKQEEQLEKLRKNLTPFHYSADEVLKLWNATLQLAEDVGLSKDCTEYVKLVDLQDDLEIALN